jgi:hypothetical protein
MKGEVNRHAALAQQIEAELETAEPLQRRETGRTIEVSSRLLRDRRS